jgi:hypothetical protein
LLGGTNCGTSSYKGLLIRLESVELDLQALGHRAGSHNIMDGN